MAAARCAVTDSPELLSRTVSRPSQAWNPTRTTTPIDGHRRLGRSRWSRTATNARAEDDEPDCGGHRPMDPLDPGLVVVERRDQLAVAEGPVRTAHARVGRPNDDTDRHQRERHRDAEHRQSLEPGQRALPGGRPAGDALRGLDGPAILARAPFRPLPATLSAMTPRTRWTALLAAVLLLAAACGPATPTRTPLASAPASVPASQPAAGVLPQTDLQRARQGTEPVRLFVPRRERHEARGIAGPNGNGRVQGARRRIRGGVPRRVRLGD